MPEPTNPKTREYLPSANRALAELEEVTGKPVLLLEEPDLGIYQQSCPPVMPCEATS